MTATKNEPGSVTTCQSVIDSQTAQRMGMTTETVSSEQKNSEWLRGPGWRMECVRYLGCYYDVRDRLCVTDMDCVTLDVTDML